MLAGLIDAGNVPASTIGFMLARSHALRHSIGQTDLGGLNEHPARRLEERSVRA